MAKVPSLPVVPVPARGDEHHWSVYSRTIEPGSAVPFRVGVVEVLGEAGTTDRSTGGAGTVAVTAITGLEVSNIAPRYATVTTWCEPGANARSTVYDPSVPVRVEATTTPSTSASTVVNGTPRPRTASTPTYRAGAWARTLEGPLTLRLVTTDWAPAVETDPTVVPSNSNTTTAARPRPRRPTEVVSQPRNVRPLDPVTARSVRRALSDHLHRSGNCPVTWKRPRWLVPGCLERARDRARLLSGKCRSRRASWENCSASRVWVPGWWSVRRLVTDEREGLAGLGVGRDTVRRCGAVLRPRSTPVCRGSRRYVALDAGARRQRAASRRWLR